MPDNALAHEPRPHAFTKAQDIAKHLGPDWKAVDRECNWMASIHGPGLRSLTLNMGTWRNGRLTIIGSIERLALAYRDDRVPAPWAIEPMPTITVDPNKDGENIAKDILRRLSADYEALYERMVRKYEGLKQSIAERDSVAETLRALTGCDEPTKFYPFEVRTKGVILCVDDADSIRFSHSQSFTLDQMRRLIEAIPEIFR